MSRNPEDIGGFSVPDFREDEAAHGAQAQFHDLLYRPGGSLGPNSSPGFNDPQRELGHIFHALKREGELDPQTIAALRLLDERLGDQRGGPGFHDRHGGFGHHHRYGGTGAEVVPADYSQSTGDTSYDTSGIPLDANGQPIAYTAMDTGTTLDTSVPVQSQIADASLQGQPGLDNTTLAQSSDSSLQSLASLWAASHGMDANDPQSYQAIQQSSDGQALAVGPYKLDANIIGQWFSQATDQNGQLNPDAIKQLVAGGRLSQQTADAVTSPDFLTFMNSFAQGQQPAGDQVAKFLPADLQNAIASDMVAGMSNALGGQNGQLDPGAVIASLEARRPLSTTELQDPSIAQFVSSIDSALTGSAQTITDQQSGVLSTDGTAAALPNTGGIAAAPPATDNATAYSSTDTESGPITVAANPALSSVDQSSG